MTIVAAQPPLIVPIAAARPFDHAPIGCYSSVHLRYQLQRSFVPSMVSETLSTGESEREDVVTFVSTTQPMCFL